MAVTRLGQVQFAIMQALWRRRTATAREITDDLKTSMDIAHSTVQTLLRQLEGKGVVAHDLHERVFVFRPLVDSRYVTRGAARDLIDRIFGGSAAGLIAHLLTEETISAAEMRKLRKLIERQKTTRG